MFIPLIMSHLSLRKARIKDIITVHSIEKASFPYPWSIVSFLQEIKNPFSLFYVVLEDKQISGYFILWDLEEEYHLANIAVSPDKRRRGIGKWIIKEILKIARKNKKRWVRLEVRVSNKPAIYLYKKMKFRKTRVLKDYYYLDKEDAIEFLYKIE